MCPKLHEVLLMQGVHHQLQSAKNEAHGVIEPLKPRLPSSDPLSHIASLSSAETAAWFQVSWVVVRFVCAETSAWPCSHLEAASGSSDLHGYGLHLLSGSCWMRSGVIVCNFQELAGGIEIEELSQRVPASVMVHPKQLVEALIQHQVPCHRAVWLIRSFLHLQQGYVGTAVSPEIIFLAMLPWQEA